MNACGDLGWRRLMYGLLMIEIISLGISGVWVCQVASWGPLAFSRHLVFISRLVSDNSPRSPWINTEPCPDIIKLPMQIYLNNTDILMTPDSVQIMKAPREGPCTMNGDIKALCSLGGSSWGLPVIMAELSFLDFLLHCIAFTIWETFSPFCLSPRGNEASLWREEVFYFLSQSPEL